MNLVEQLKPGGVMIIPVGPLAIQTMTIVLKKPNGETEVIEMDKFRFVPMLSDKARGENLNLLAAARRG